MQTIETINHLIAANQKLASMNAEIIRRLTGGTPLSLPTIKEYEAPPIDHSVYSSQFAISLN